jgi:hypothetical protein
MEPIKSAFLVAFLALVSLATTSLMAADADLTRYLATYDRTTGSPNSSSDTFFGTEGTARLIVTNGDDSTE